MSDTISLIMEEPRKFLKDSTLFIHRCTKPDRKEFTRIAQTVGIGFLIMGFIGYFVKLIHIPINNIIVYLL